MKTILIGTTAINRPALHTDIIPDWVKWISELKGYNLRWFVNIDMVDKLDPTFEETKDNFRRCVGEIEVIFMGGEKGNFLKACQKVSQKIETYVLETNLKEEDVIVFWLEDDWKLNLNVVIPIGGIIDNYMGDRCHINFSFIRNNYIHALAPGLISYRLWRDMHLMAWKSQKKHVDPEHCVGVYIGKVMNIKEEKINNLTVITKHKKINYEYFEKNRFCNYENSYYTFDDTRMVVSERYVEKGNVREKFGDEMLFVRITANFVIGGCDYGRKFMEKSNLYKARVQNEKNKNFYN